ncbi:MAG: hypothetical protein HQ569_01450 [Actinobacteria bacterium]|nr:hypothetical protein [Actinomycetota bacterium]
MKSLTFKVKILSILIFPAAYMINPSYFAPPIILLDYPGIQIRLALQLKASLIISSISTIKVKVTLISCHYIGGIPPP